MKLFISICLFTLFILNARPGFSQKEVEISGVKYMLHTVKKGETAFSLCKEYKVTQKELEGANPNLTAVLKPGLTVRIPVKKAVVEQKPEQMQVKAIATEPEYYYHKVNKKQTIFSIAKQYGVTPNELIRYNPEISNGLVPGQVLKVPVQRDETTNSATQQPKATDKSTKVASSDTPSEAGFRMHTVVAGETLYALEQKYGITHEELIRLNPSIQKGLQTGTRLKIPEKKMQPATEIEQPASSCEKYKVEKGETLFSLASRFGVEVGDLKKANPSLLSRSLEAGETILVPKHSVIDNKAVVAENSGKIEAAEVLEKNESDNCIPISGKNTQKYNIGLLLPFYLKGNDQINHSGLNSEVLISKIDFSKTVSNMPVVVTDSGSVINGANIDPRAQGFLEFYEGALLAIDSLQQKGMNIELYVFDACNQAMINELIQLEVFRNLNLIIGPVYPELQEPVASFAAKNSIPMVSPLASNGIFEESNPYYFKVNPTREFQIEQTANYIAGEFINKNFVLLPMSGSSNSAEAKLAELGKAKLLEARQATKNKNDLFHEYSFQQQGVNALNPLLDETGENIFIIPTDNEAQVSVAVTNLNALAEKYNVVLIGTSNLTKLKSIQTENYHHIRLRFLSPTFVDYKKLLVRRFVSQYRETFSGEPSQFSFQGFDVSYYFLSALYRYGKDFRNCLPTYPMELTQMDFNFRKVNSIGGFMNQGLFVTAYERNYDILNYGITGSK